MTQSIVRRFVALALALYKNPLAQLVLVQAIFVALGLTILEFHLSPLDVAAALATAVLTEWAVAGRRGFPWSPLAAGFGIAIFLRASSPLYFAIAAFLAIASKYLIRWRGGHLFNPSNFAIVSLILVFPYAATVEFTQWGGNPYVFLLLSGIVFAVAYRAGVLLTTVTFISAYTAILFALSTKYSLIYTAHHYGILGPSFVLFASFMITDPRTSPTTRGGRILHGISIAILYFVLETAGIRYSLFICTFLITILNLVSRETVRVVPYLTQRAAGNLFTFLALTVLGSYMLLPLVLGETQHEPERLSAQFILFGVSQHAAEQCVPADGRAFVSNPEVIPDRIGWTTGAAWGDYDGDGYDDLFVSRADGSRLFQNRAGELFDITEQAGLGNIRASSGFLVDYDNDGDRDLFVYQLDASELAHLKLYQYEQGRFSDNTDRAGLSSNAQASDGTMTFADFNNDGWLDLVTATPGSYIRLERNELTAFSKMLSDPFFPRNTRRVCGSEIDPHRGTVAELADAEGLTDEINEVLSHEDACLAFDYGISLFRGATLEPSGPVTSMTAYIPGDVQLFENQTGTFREQAALPELVQELYAASDTQTDRYQHPFTDISRVFWQPVAVDYNNDGLQDIFFSIDLGANLLLRNDGSFNFTDVTKEAGFDYAGSGMGVAVSDTNGDNMPDIFVDNIDTDYFFESVDEGAYQNSFAEYDIGTLGVGWGAAFLDYDLDGFEDLILTNGDIVKTPLAVIFPLTQPLYRSDRLYRNTSEGFTDATELLCPDLQSGKALAVSDYDNDGDPDVYVGNLNRPQEVGSGDVLYENTSKDRSYLRVQLTGTKSNRMAAGARVDVESEGRTQTKYLIVGSSFYSQNSSTLLFGLGTSTDPVILTAYWPSGETTVLSNVGPNQTLKITEKE